MWPGLCNTRIHLETFIIVAIPSGEQCFTSVYMQTAVSSFNDFTCFRLHFMHHHESVSPMKEKRDGIGVVLKKFL